MVDSADEPPLSTRLHSWAKNTTLSPVSLNSLRASRDNQDPVLPTTRPQPDFDFPRRKDAGNNPPAAGPATSDQPLDEKDNGQQDIPSVDQEGDGAQSSTIGSTESKATQSLGTRIVRDVKRIIFSSWINWLLLVVPVGLILGALVDWGHSDIVDPTVVFALNAVAIIPLASLLSFATESVAIRMGDTVGALLNVTFGNAVEIIIFIIGLVANEVRIVQAAAIGSILSNLLLILGMCFVVGGLRFREQLYNSTVSQMSACLLCLSVISLLLPTAFHASFSDADSADNNVLKVSRGTSVVLLLVYVLYLLFQLKSHAFMYQSTPQHLIDEESHPGVLAEMLNTSSSSSGSSSPSSSDTDSSSNSRSTAKRFKRALRRKRRKSMSSTKDNAPVPIITRSSSNLTNHGCSITQTASPASPELEAVISGDEADLDGEGRRARRRSRTATFRARDFESEAQPDNDSENSKKERKKSKMARKLKRSKKEKRKSKQVETDIEKSPVVEPEVSEPAVVDPTYLHVPQVEFCSNIQEIPNENLAKSGFNIRNLSDAVRPAFSSSMFPHHEATGRPLAMPMRPTSQPRSNSRGLRRTSSMPDILHRTTSSPRTSPLYLQPVQNIVPVSEAGTEVEVQDVVEPQAHLSRTSAVIMLLITTGLVALCAEFLVNSIDHLISTTNVSQAFVGLIILPIVGNAAEHVTAVTVAAKNKMDLAINIALGSSIQIALFVTPLMVILGWILDREMSLYFSLFETVSLFASAFIVSFLMIDGRSNYLEGALLIAAYVIIALGAFFYPKCNLSANTGAIDDGLGSRC